MQNKMRPYVAILLCAIVVFVVIFSSLPKQQPVQVAENAQIAEIVPLVRHEQIIVYQNNIPRFPSYSLHELYDLDLRKPSGVTEADLKKVTRQGLVGLERAFFAAEQKYGVNCLFLISVAALESGWGTIMFRPNNMFGFGNRGFSSKEECIDYVARQISIYYFGKGQYTPRTINRTYAANPAWYSRVSGFMNSMYQTIRATKDTTPPLPAELFVVGCRGTTLPAIQAIIERKYLFFSKII